METDDQRRRRLLAEREGCLAERQVGDGSNAAFNVVSNSTEERA